MEVIDQYAIDYPNLRTYSDRYLPPLYPRLLKQRVADNRLPG
jgi:hypothetical protein